MLTPLPAIALLSVGAVIGSIFYAYNQGEKKCTAEQQVIALNAQVKFLNDQLNKSQEWVDFNSKLAGEAEKQAKLEQEKSAKLQATIDSYSDDNTIVVDADFLQQLNSLSDTASIKK